MPRPATLTGGALLGAAAVTVAAAATRPVDAVKELFPQTPAEVADFVFSSMNASVNPCDDAYTWACGGWDAANTGSRNYGAIADRVEVALDKLLRVAPLKDTNPGILYNDCLNLDSRPHDLSVLARYGPVLRAVSANGTYASVVSALATMHSNSGGEPLFETGTIRDSRTEYGVKVLKVYRPVLGMSKKGFRGSSCRDKEVQAAYKTMLVAFMRYANEAGLLGGADDRGMAASGWASAEEAAEAVYAFEERIQVFKTAGYRAYKNATNQPKVNYLPLATTKELELVSATFSMLGVKVPTGLAVIKYPVYFGSLNDWIRADVVGNANNGRAILQAYLAYKVTRSFGAKELVGPDVQAAYRAYKAVSTNGRRVKPRAERCFSRVADRFPVEISAAFMDNFFGPDKVAFAKGMAKDIRAAYDARLKASAWLDTPTKAAAVAKLAAMKLVVADNTPNGPEDNMADVVCTKGDYASSYLSANTHLWRVQWHRLANPRAPHQASLRSWRTNARYDGYRNEIYIPSATLSSPTFNPAAPHALTFGAAGRTMGHEMGHGLDSKNRVYDARGLRVNWWSDASDAAFEKRAQCFVNVFDGYKPSELPGKHVDGQNTLKENLADAAGIRSAWAAFQARKAAGATGPRNAALSAKFNEDQLFFLGAAQIWCKRLDVEELADDLLNDVHSPKRYRVEGTLSQFGEFAKAFNCPAGSRYNPANKCSLY